MKKRILFVCKHNLFRSQVSEILFNKLNKNKNYTARSAGLVRWDLKALKNDKNYQIEKKVCSESKIRLIKKSNGLNHDLLKETNILVITADDVPKNIFENEKSFNGEILVWKVKDVKEKYADKEKIVLETIKFLEKKVNGLVRTLQ